MDKAFSKRTWSDKPSVVTAILNFKGGVGKTTIAAHISRCIKEQKSARVLLIDLDPQFNLTQLLLPPQSVAANEKNKKNAYRLFAFQPGSPIPFRGARRAPSPESLVAVVAEGGSSDKYSAVHLVPGSFDLARFSISWNLEGRRVADDIFEEFLEACRRFYDYIFLDLNPGVSPITYIALGHSDYILTPFIHDRYSYHGLKLMREFLKTFFPDKAQNPDFHIGLLNMASIEMLTKQTAVERWARSATVKVLTNKLPASPVLKTHPSAHGTFYDAPESPFRSREEVSRISEALSNVAEELIEKIAARQIGR